MSARPSLVPLLRGVLMLVPVLGLGTGTALAWPPEPPSTLPPDDGIQPGVRVLTNGNQWCTSNFVFTDGADLYLGVAAHCARADTFSLTNDGCHDPSHPIGTPVDVEGATESGALAYSSWIAMQSANEANLNGICQWNDFALVRIHPQDHDRVDPAVRHFGGPTRVASSADIQANRKVLSYGHSFARLGIDPLNWKEGYVTATPQPLQYGSWHALFVTPGVPGDSGSGVMLADGEAAGILVTLDTGGSNGMANLGKTLAYAADHGAAVQLVSAPLATAGLLPPSLP